MKTQTQHTPTPWDVSTTDDIAMRMGLYADINAGPARIGAMSNWEDAAFIVRAVNNYQAMLSMLRSLRNSNTIPEVYQEKLDDIISQAEGK